MTTFAPHPDDKSPLAEKAATKTAKHVSEGGHFYDRRANQIVEVMNAKGTEMTKCTLKHARTLDLAPGVTTIIKEAAAPQLILWLRRQSIMAALTLPRLHSETEQEWMARVEADMDTASRQAAEKGSAIHAAVQAHFQGEAGDPEFKDHLRGVLAALPSLTTDMWSTEVPVVSPAGYGTKIDLISEEWLLDFKTKDGDQKTLDDLKPYDEHAMQLAAGRQAMVEGFCATKGLSSNPTRKCGILFVSRTHPGACALKPVEESALIRGWEMFQCLLSFWQKKTGHVPFKGGF